MKKQPYMPTEDAEFVPWLKNFAEKFEQHSAALGYESEEVKSVNEDSSAFNQTMDMVVRITDDKEEVVKWKNILRDGPVGTPLGASPAPSPAPAVTATPAGIKPRIRQLVQNIKSNKKYNDSIGKDLGIIGDEHEVDLASLKPELKLVFKGGAVEVQWKKGVADAVLLEVMRSGSEWTFLAIDSEPHYTDTAPITEPATWKYRAIYLLHDEQIGQRSDVASITVG